MVIFVINAWSNTMPDGEEVIVLLVEIVSLDLVASLEVLMSLV